MTLYVANLINDVVLLLQIHVVIEANAGTCGKGGTSFTLGNLLLPLKLFKPSVI